MNLRALWTLKRAAKPAFTFVSERGAPIAVALPKLVERAGIAAKIGFKVHPHMLRHAAGFVLANKGTDTRTLQAYLDHRSALTELAPSDCKNLMALTKSACQPDPTPTLDRPGVVSRVEKGARQHIKAGR